MTIKMLQLNLYTILLSLPLQSRAAKGQLSEM